MYEARQNKEKVSRVISTQKQKKVQQLYPKNDRNNIVQRLIVTDEKDASDFIILASIGAYLQHKGESKVDYIDMADYRNETKLYIVAHGDTEKIGDKNPKDMAKALTKTPNGISQNMNFIFLAACESGKIINGNDSYAHKLKSELNSYKNTQIIGIPGEATITNLDNAEEMPVGNDKLSEANTIDAEARHIYEEDINTAISNIKNFENMNLTNKAKIVYNMKNVEMFFKMFMDKKASFAPDRWEKTVVK